MGDADYTPSPEEQVILDWLSTSPFYERNVSLFYDHDDGYDFYGMVRHGIASGWHHEPITCAYCAEPILPRRDARHTLGGMEHPECAKLSRAEREEAERPAREEAERVRQANAAIAAERGHASYRRIEPDPDAKF